MADEIGQLEAELADARNVSQKALDAARAAGYASGEASNRVHLLRAVAQVETARRERADAVERAEAAEVRLTVATDDLREKQAALEILGRAMGVIVPNARGTGTASEHAQMIADQATAAVAKMQKDRDDLRDALRCILDDQTATGVAFPQLGMAMRHAEARRLLGRT